MATKTISITEDAYKRLASLRKSNESFSEIITRVTGRTKLDDFFGVLSEKTAKEIETNIKKMREENKKKSEERISRIVKELS